MALLGRSSWCRFDRTRIANFGADAMLFRLIAMAAPHSAAIAYLL